MNSQRFQEQRKGLKALCPEVQNLLFALEQYLHVSFFRYVKSYPDHSKYIVCNNASWLDAYFDDEFYDTELASYHKHPKHSHGISIHGKCHENHPSCIFWNRHKKIGSYSQIMAFYVKYDSYFEIYDFGLNTTEHQANNLFLNNQKIFKHFFLYFKCRGRPVLEKADLLRFTSDSEENYDDSENWMLGVTDQLAHIAIQEMRLTDFHLEDELAHIDLTISEARSLKVFLEGYTFTEAPDLIGLSSARYKVLLQSVMRKVGVDSFFALRKLCHEKHINRKLAFLDEEQVK